MATNSIMRESKHYEYNVKFGDPEKIDINNFSKDNIVNYFLILTQKDITYTFMMETFGEFNGESLVHPYDTFTVPEGRFSYTDNKGKVHSNKNKFVTTFGIWVFNIFLLQGFNFSQYFGGYVNKEINTGALEDINQMLVYFLAEEKIDIATYKKFQDYTLFLMPFENILAYTFSEEVLRFSHTIEKKKKELIEANKEKLDAGDFAVAEKVEKELINYAKEILKDNPGLDSYMSGAGGSLGNNFKNIYIMKGAIRDPDPNAKQQFNIVTSNFCDGISADEYSVVANSLAAGPYARSKKTEQGGYWEKLFGAALQSIVLDESTEDCGSKGYVEVELTAKNINIYMYNYIIEGSNLVELTSDNMNKYIGKKVKMRFSIFCQSPNGICKTCAGNLFSRRNSKNIGLTCIQIPSTLKNVAMKSFHDSTIKTTTIDAMKAFGLK